MSNRPPRPWLVRQDERLGPQGRHRSGPEGVAVRELARVTIRASARTLAYWDALRDAEQLPPHELFERLIENYLNRLEPDTRSALMRTAKRIRRDRYPNVP